MEKKTKRKTKGNWKTVGFITVDSGTIMVADPCYFDGDENVKNLRKERLDCFETPTMKHDNGNPGLAVFTGTAFGDGIYEVDIYEEDGVPKCLMINLE